jgi:hypothetical protein
MEKQTQTKSEIIEAINKMTFYADRRDFENLSKCYGEKITQYDAKGLINTQTNEELIQGVKEVLPGYDVLFHLCTNHFVTIKSDTEAEVTFNIYCVHTIGDEKMINLSYSTNFMEYVDGRWVIVGSKGEFLKQFGNTKLVEKARESVKEGLVASE